jgi:Ni/Fe-hydrogenase subunit HybB-like protein
MADPGVRQVRADPMRKPLFVGFAVHVTSWSLTALCGATIEWLVRPPHSSLYHSALEGFVLFSLISTILAVASGLGFGSVLLVRRAFTLRLTGRRLLNVSCFAGVASVLMTFAALQVALRWPELLPRGLHLSVVLQLIILAPLIGGATGAIGLSVAQLFGAVGARRSRRSPAT